PLRQPIRKLMIASTVATATLVLLIIMGNLFFDAGISLKQFLSPAETSSVAITVIAGVIALLSASIYLSDTRGMIESEPDGFFDVASLICSRLSMIVTAAIVLVMFFEVVSRYVFIRPTLWAN